jgi:hypothetical protein
LSVISPPVAVPETLDRDGDRRRASAPTIVRVARLVRRPPAGALVNVLLAIATVAHGWGMTRSPGALDDEGTYVAQAWAVQNWGSLAHYTYWYDHPPLGWLQIALWTEVTGAFRGTTYAVLAGRELMLVAQLASCLLLYALGRRLGMRRPAVTLAVLLFALSPLAVVFHRYVLLDNIATPWLLGAFVLAASPRRHLGAAAGAGVCMAVAVLTKETTLVLLPVLVWQLWSNGDKRTRHFTMALFAGSFASLLAAYPLLALLKSELIPGEGHVSLLGSIAWQLFGRSTSGSVLDPNSGARGLFNLWLGIDPWLLWAGMLLVPLALRWPRLRPVALGLAVQAVMMLRNGYLPYPYVIAMLPFAALVVGGVVDQVWGFQGDGWTRAVQAWRERPGVLARRASVVAVLAVFAVAGLPMWARGLHDQMTTDRTVALRQAAGWLSTNARPQEVVVVDDSLWVDLVERGLSPEKVIWFYKVDLDPAVKLPDGWHSIAYVVLGELSPTTSGLPTVSAAIDHSTVVATFGSGPDSLTIRKVAS